MRLHADEHAIDTALVRRLVDTQFPAYRALPLRPLPAPGSSNRLFKLGDELLVRLPRQPGGGDTIAREHRWLPHIRRHLPVAAPEPVALGDADEGYAEQWGITRWIEGDPATTEHTGSMFAEQLAETVRALRNAPVPDAALNDPHLAVYRGQPLAAFNADFERSLRRCQQLEGFDEDLEAAADVWQRALQVKRPALQRWLHGDIVAENVLVRGDHLAAVLDFGMLGVGDPAAELHGVWELLDAAQRETFRARVDADDDTWLVGRAWAVGIALSALSYYWHTLPERRTHHLQMLRAATSPDA